MTRSLQIDTPFGPVVITASDEGITEVRFQGIDAPKNVADRLRPQVPCCSEQEAPELLQRAARELREYFAGRRERFTLPLAPRGSAFQQKVWNALRGIGYAEVRTYGQIARQIGHPKAFRAVGMANNRNPIAILIPCHRVIGSDGALTGYAAGIGIKQRLLDLERAARLRAEMGW